MTPIVSEPIFVAWVNNDDGQTRVWPENAMITYRHKNVLPVSKVIKEYGIE
jgi:hypothetical protein